MATDADTQPTSPPPPPPAPSHPRRLVRYPDRGRLGGVCEGIAEYANLDPTLVRIGAVVLACLGPGVPVYILAWIFVPEADGTTLVPRHRRRRHEDRFGSIAGIVLIGIALSVLWGDWWSPARGWLLPLSLLLFGGYLLFRPDQDDDDLPPPPPPGPGAVPWSPSGPSSTSVAPVVPTPPTGATEPTAGDDATDVADAATAELPMEDGDGTGPPTDVLPTTAAVPPPPPPTRRGRRRRVLGPLVFGALLLWGGFAWLIGVEVQTGLAIGLCILGAGFVAGAFVGGSRALIFPALLVTAALIAVSVVDIPLDGGIGEKRWVVESSSDLASPYEQAIGDATLDLGDLPLTTGKPVHVKATVGIGHLLVIVPEGARVVADVEVGAGQADVLGRTDDGMNVDVRRSFDGDVGAGTLTLDLHVGLGHIEVREAGRVARDTNTRTLPTTPPTPTTPPEPIGTPVPS